MGECGHTSRDVPHAGWSREVDVIIEQEREVIVAVPVELCYNCAFISKD